MTIFHMKEMLSNKRHKIKEKDVMTLQVPHFEGLKIETFLEYAAAHPLVMETLPSIARERECLPRAYIANVIYTLVGEPFKKWV